LQAKLTQRTTFQAKHTSKNVDHSEAAAEAADVAVDSAAVEIDAAAEDTAETEIEATDAVAAVTGQDTKFPMC
jgi:Trk K+ transport system NAD-binding subunit